MAPKTEKVRKQVIKYLERNAGEDFTPQEIASAIGYPHKCVTKALEHFAVSGEIQQDGDLFVLRPGASLVETVEHEPQVEVDVPGGKELRVGRGRKFDPDVDEIKKQLEKRSIKQLSRDLDVPYSTLHGWLKRNNLLKPGRELQRKQAGAKPNPKPEPVVEKKQGVSLMMYGAENSFKFNAYLTLEQAEAVAATVINPPEEE